jgi:cbb3-type cytochrome oxidase subunit 3
MDLTVFLTMCGCFVVLVCFAYRAQYKERKAARMGGVMSNERM